MKNIFDCIAGELGYPVSDCSRAAGLSWVFFVREEQSFLLDSYGGFDRPPPGFPILESPDLWENLQKSSPVVLPDEGLVVCIDQPSDPKNLIVFQSKEGLNRTGSGEVFQLLFSFMIRERGLYRHPGGTAGKRAYSSLPIWHEKSIHELSEKGSPLLIQGEPGSAIGELVQSFVSHESGGLEDLVTFYPGRLSPAVQLRELFGDPAGVRLGGKGATVPFVDRKGVYVVIHEVGQLADLVQLRLLNLLSSQRVHQHWLFLSTMDLKSMVEAGQFQEGLYRILEASTVVVPPVRNHKDQLPGEVDRLLGEYRIETSRQVSMGEEAMEAILDYDWPGNHSELKRTLEAAFYLCDSDQIERKDLRLGAYADAPAREDDLDLRRCTRDLEERMILRAHALHGGNQMQMARALGISRGSLQYKLEKFGLG